MRQVFHRLFQPAFGTTAQLPLHQQDGEAAKGDGRYRRLDQREGQAEIGSGRNTQGRHENEHIHKALQSLPRSVRFDLSPSEHRVRRARGQNGIFTVCVNNRAGVN